MARRVTGRGFAVAVALVVSSAGVLALPGCAGWEPFEPELPREIPDGPGLLTGPDGAFVIERRAPIEPAGETDEPDEPEEERALRPEDGRP